MLATKPETSAPNRWLPLVFHVAQPYTWPSILPAKANTLLPPWWCLLKCFTRVGWEASVRRLEPGKLPLRWRGANGTSWNFLKGLWSVNVYFLSVAPSSQMTVLNNGATKFPARFWRALHNHIFHFCHRMASAQWIVCVQGRRSAHDVITSLLTWCQWQQNGEIRITVPCPEHLLDRAKICNPESNCNVKICTVYLPKGLRERIALKCLLMLLSSLVKTIGCIQQ